MLSSSEKYFGQVRFKLRETQRASSFSAAGLAHELQFSRMRSNDIKSNMFLGGFNQFQPFSTFFNPCQLTRRIRSGFAQTWVIQWFVITERSGNRSPDCNFHADPESQKQQRIENDEFPAPLELQLPVLLQDPCRPS